MEHNQALFSVDLLRAGDKPHQIMHAFEAFSNVQLRNGPPRTRQDGRQLQASQRFPLLAQHAKNVAHEGVALVAWEAALKDVPVKAIHPWGHLLQIIPAPQGQPARRQIVQHPLHIEKLAAALLLG